METIAVVGLGYVGLICGPVAKDNVAMNEMNLRSMLSGAFQLKPCDRVGPNASVSLVEALREFIGHGER